MTDTSTPPRLLTRPDGSWTRFTATSSDTGGDYVEVETVYRPHSPHPPLHCHPSQREDFTVLNGTLTARLGDEVGTYAAGEVFSTQPGMAHAMWNDEDEPATVRWRTSPALRTEEMFRALHRLAVEGASGAERAAVMAGFAAEYEPVAEY